LVVTSDFSDRDIIVTAGSDEERLVTLMFIRNGYLLGSRNFDLFDCVGSDADILGAFIRQYYEKTEFVPKEVLVAVQLPDRRLLEEILSRIKSRKVRIIRPQRGEKVRLVEMASENAALALKNQVSARSGERELLQRLGKRLRMDHSPRLIECIDNSNLGATAPVAGLVVFENGRPKKAAYRKYVIRDVKAPDDYATMAEVLGRRFGDKEASRPMPDLLMLDGGKGQLNIAGAVLCSLGLEDALPMLAIAKKDEARGESEDKIYLPGRSNPLTFGRDHDLLLFLQRIRDEAHRFAVSFHRRRRSKELLASELDGIYGVGPKRKRALLKRFGSIDNIRLATIEEIAATPGMDRRTAAAVIGGLGEGKAPEGSSRGDDCPPG
jgi:excinuclease ABC subunit C